MSATDPQCPYPETADIHTSSDGYAARFSGAVGAWMLAVQEGGARDLLRGFEGSSVLDVGGGHGQLALPLGRAGWNVTVLGSDESCRRRIQAAVDSGACRFVAGDVLALPFPDRSFDVALCFRLLTHCARWPELVGELCRVARRAVVVDYPTGRSLNAVAPALFGAKKKLEGNTRTWTLFRGDEVDGEFAQRGFARAAEAKQFCLPMVLHRTLKIRAVAAGLEGACRALGLTRRWGSPVIARYEPAARR